MSKVNEKELLILAELSYLDFKKSDWEETKTLQNIVVESNFKHQLGDKKLEEKTPVYCAYKETLENGNPMSGWKLLYSANHNKLKNDNSSLGLSEKDSGFEAAAYVNDEGKVVIAYRGTDENADWFQANKQIGLSQNSEQFICVKEFYENTIKKYKKYLENSDYVIQNDDITITGHSLGGGLAQYASVITGGKHQTFTWSGVGIKNQEKITKSDFYSMSEYNLDIGENFNVLLKILTDLGYISELDDTNLKITDKINNIELDGNMGFLNEFKKKGSEFTLEILKNNNLEGVDIEFAEKTFSTDITENEINKLFNILKLTKTFQTNYIETDKTKYNDLVKNYMMSKDITPNLQEKVGKSYLVDCNKKEITNVDSIPEHLGELLEMAIGNGVAKYHGVSNYLPFLDESGNLGEGLNDDYLSALMRKIADDGSISDEKIESWYKGGVKKEDVLKAIGNIRSTNLEYYIKENIDTIVSKINEKELWKWSGNQINVEDSTDVFDTMFYENISDKDYSNCGTQVTFSGYEYVVENKKYKNLGEYKEFQNENHTVLGGKDSSTIYGSKEEDRIYGGAGNDTIYGGEGHLNEAGEYHYTTSKDKDKSVDYLNGGKGNDMLVGGKGNDIYEFSTGDGQDTIIEQGEYSLLSVEKGFFQRGSYRGKIVINGQEIKGTAKKISANKYEMSVSGTNYELDYTSGNLIINYGAGDKVTVKAYQNYDMGIELKGLEKPLSTAMYDNIITLLKSGNDLQSIIESVVRITCNIAKEGEKITKELVSIVNETVRDYDQPSAKPALCGFFDDFLGMGWGIGQMAANANAMTSKYAKYVNIDPLILDLNGDGVKTTKLSEGSYFDLDNSQFAEKTGWVSPEDGMLTLDKNNDNKITNGNELFGDQTYLKNGKKADSGFEALSEYDENQDGKIDENDSVYSDLRIWQDENQDGVSQKEELKTMEELGIKSLNLSSDKIGKETAEGNILSRAGNYTTSDGISHEMSEYLLKRNPIDRRERITQLKEDIKGLVNVEATGNMDSLLQAITADETGELEYWTKVFTREKNPKVRKDLIELISRN